MADSFIQFLLTRIVPSVVVALGTTVVSTKIVLYLVERTARGWGYNSCVALFDSQQAQNLIKSVSGIDMTKEVQDVMDNLDTEKINDLLRDIVDAVNSVDTDKFVSAVNSVDMDKLANALNSVANMKMGPITLNLKDAKELVEAVNALDKKELVNAVNALDKGKLTSLLNDVCGFWTDGETREKKICHNCKFQLPVLPRDCVYCRKIR